MKKRKKSRRRALLLPALILASTAVAVFMTLPKYPGKQIQRASDRQARKRTTPDSAPEQRLSTSEQAIEQFYQDSFGTKPIAADFDAEPGALCGNGKSYYWTSKPPKKPIPDGWSPPPPPGSLEGEYLGPDPLAPIKESPYAMPAPRVVLRRQPLKDIREQAFLTELKRLRMGEQPVAIITGAEPPARVRELLAKTSPVPIEHLRVPDDRPLAEQLLSKGVSFLIASRLTPEPAPWAEPDYARLDIRLRDGLPLAWFHPVLIGSAFIVYRIAPPSSVTPDEMNAITRYVRKALAGENVPAPDVSERFPRSEPSVYRIIVSLRARGLAGLKGRKIARKIGRGKSVEQALDHAVRKLAGDWNGLRTSTARLYNVSLPEAIPAALPQLQIEIEVMSDLARLTDKSLRRLRWNFELGLDGLGLFRDDTLYYLEPAYALHRGKTSEYQFLLKLLTRSGLKRYLTTETKGGTERTAIETKNWFADRHVTLGRFRTVHWIESPDGEIVPLHRGVPLRTPNSVTKEALTKSLQLGADWLMQNQGPDGQYGYKYEPLNRPGKRWYPGGNIVRHGLNPYTLLLVHSISPDPRLVESAKRGIDFTLRFLRRSGSRCVICHRDPPARYYNAKIGTNAVTILSLLKLADVEDISAYRDVLDCLAEEILFLQDPNGHFRQYDVPEDHPYFGAESTIPPGQFIFVLARLYRHLGDTKFLDAARRALPYYMEQWRHFRANRTADGIYDEETRTNLVGIVPWLVMGLNELHAATSEEHFAELAFELQDWVDDTLMYSPTRSAYLDSIGSAFKTHAELPAINACQFIEGASAAFDLAKRTGNAVAQRRQTVLLGARFCLQLQYDGYGSTFFLPDPGDAMGGYRYHLGETRLRNDYSYHAMAALAQTVQYLSEDDFPPAVRIEFPGTIQNLLEQQGF